MRIRAAVFSLFQVHPLVRDQTDPAALSWVHLSLTAPAVAGVRLDLPTVVTASTDPDRAAVGTGPRRAVYVVSTPGSQVNTSLKTWSVLPSTGRCTRAFPTRISDDVRWRWLGSRGGDAGQAVTGASEPRRAW